MTFSVDLGKIKFTWKGDWSAQTTYKKDDVVYRAGSSYICLPTTSVNQDPNTSPQWGKIAQGSDLGGISGISAGDMFYFDGTDFQRLSGNDGDSLIIENGVPSFATPPGSIMEVLTGICDGSEITVRSGTYTMPSVTTNQALTTSYANMSGSVLSYTPPVGATRVKYEYEFMFEDQEYGGISHYRFYIDGVEVVAAYTNLAHQYSTSSHGQDMVTLSWVIDCAADADNTTYGKFTSWTEPKELKWMAREYSGSYEARLHLNTWFDGSGASGSRTFIIPKLTITAIR